MRYDEEGGFLTLHLEDYWLQPGDDVQIAFPPRVAIAELVLLASGVLLGEARLHLPHAGTAQQQSIHTADDN